MFINNISYYIMNDPKDLEFGDNLLKNPSPPGSPVKAQKYHSTPPGTPKTMTAADKKEKELLESFKSKETEKNYGAMGSALGGKRKTRKAKKSKRKSKKSKRKSRKYKKSKRKTRRK